jgi:hypothetical protein
MPHRLHAINYRVFTTLLVVGLPVFVIGSYFVIASGRAHLRDAFGATLAQRAEQSAAAIDAYVYRRVVDVSLLARVPDVRRLAAATPDRPLDGAAAAALDRRFAALDLKSPVVAEVLGNPASRYFTEITRQDPVYRELLLTDRAGRLIGASNLTSDYYQADEDWWQRVMADEQGEATVSDVRWDDSARTYAMEIAVPVPGDDGRPAGVLKAVADIREMLASVAGIDLGSGGEAMVVRHNGSIVFRRGTQEPNARFFAASRLQQALAPALQEGGLTRLSFSATDTSGDAQLVGAATCQLASTYPHLPWAVVVWESEPRALAPVNSLFRSLLLVLAMTMLAVLGLAFWFSTKLIARPLETEMDLVPHPHITRVAEEETV